MINVISDTFDKLVLVCKVLKKNRVDINLMD